MKFLLKRFPMRSAARFIHATAAAGMRAYRDSSSLLAAYFCIRESTLTAAEFWRWRGCRWIRFPWPANARLLRNFARLAAAATPHPVPCGRGICVPRPGLSVDRRHHFG
jgi:hypothetical protein